MPVDTQEKKSSIFLSTVTNKSFIMSAYQFKVPKKCDVGIDRQLEIALVNAQMEDDEELRDTTRFDSFTLDVDGVYEFTCSSDNSMYTVIPASLIKTKVRERMDELYLWKPEFLAEVMKSPTFDLLPLRDRLILFTALQEAEVNLIIIIQFESHIIY
jgi:hypothetical protein